MVCGGCSDRHPVGDLVNLMASDDAFVFKTIKEHVITGETATRVAALRVINLIINKCDDVEETFRDADMKGMQSKIVLRTVSVGSIKVCNLRSYCVQSVSAV